MLTRGKVERVDLTENGVLSAEPQPHQALSGMPIPHASSGAAANQYNDEQGSGEDRRGHRQAEVDAQAGRTAPCSPTAHAVAGEGMPGTPPECPDP